MKCLKPKEHEVQQAIVQALRAAGFHVYETTAYRQKGPSGADKGVPDLLVSHENFPFYFIGLEVKRDSKASLTAEQKKGVAADRYVVVWDEVTALDFCWRLLLDRSEQEATLRAGESKRPMFLKKVLRLLQAFEKGERRAA